MCLQVAEHLTCSVQNPIPTSKPGVEPKRPGRPVDITSLCRISPTVSNHLDVSWASEFGRVCTLRLFNRFEGHKLFSARLIWTCCIAEVTPWVLPPAFVFMLVCVVVYVACVECVWVWMCFIETNWLNKGFSFRITLFLSVWMDSAFWDIKNEMSACLSVSPSVKAFVSH